MAIRTQALWLMSNQFGSSSVDLDQFNIGIAQVFRVMHCSLDTSTICFAGVVKPGSAGPRASVLVMLIYDWHWTHVPADMLLLPRNACTTTQ